MRHWTLSCLLSAIALLWVAQATQATPITGGTGPGGFGTTDGSSSLELWYKANTLTAVGNGNPINTWTDSSGNGRNVSQVGTDRPTFATNVVNTSQPVVRFNGSGQRLTLDNSINSFALGTITVVAKHDTSPFPTYNSLIGSSQQPVYTFLGNSGNTNWYLGENRLTSYFTNGNNTSNIGTVSRITDFNIYSGYDSGVRTPNDLSIGHDRNGRFWDGDVAEIIVHSRVLNTPERILMENHLASKYDAPNSTYSPATTLVNDRYDGDTSAKGNYDFGVFGVLNIAGVSVTNSGMDGFGLEGTPGLNQGALAGYKVQNNSIVDEAVSLGNSMYAASRWDRAWYVDSDESFGATLGFNSVDAGLGALDNSEQYFVLFRSTEVGDWTALGQGTLAGNLISLNVDTLLSGYYTIALNVSYIPEPNGLLLMLGVLGCGMLRRRKR